MEDFQNTSNRMSTTTNTQLAVTKPSALNVMAAKYNTDPTRLLETLKSTVFTGANNEELMALVLVANEHGLNPFTREIYAFPKKGGGIQAVVSIDGWVRIMNQNPDFDGINFDFAGDGDDMACTATIHRKSIKHPVVVTEYFAECVRQTEPWKTCPRRMLRHKALIQAVRVAFGFSACDPDDAEIIQMRNITRQDPVIPEDVLPRLPMATQESTTQQPEPSQQLSDVVTSSGFTFDDFREWCGKSGHITDTDSLSGFQDIAPTVAKRILRIKVDMLRSMTEAKRGEK